MIEDKDLQDLTDLAVNTLEDWGYVMSNDDIVDEIVKICKDESFGYPQDKYYDIKSLLEGQGLL